MRIGIPKEIKPGECRVAGLPAHAAQLAAMGCEVVVQRGAGAAARFDDRAYAEAGAALVDSLAQVYERADILWKVKEIMPQEFPLLRPNHVIFTYLHACPRPEMTKAILESGAAAIAYEEMTDEDGRRPLLAPMSRMAGTGAVILAGQFCQSIYGGCGKMLFRSEGVEPLSFTIIGGGTAGRAAARAALAAGAQVRLFEIAEPLIARLEKEFPEAEILSWSSDRLRELLPATDVLVNCTFWTPGDPHLVTRDMLALMRPGSLIMDVAADPGGAVETSVETTHDDPIRVIDGIMHYGTQNIPALFGRSASEVLSAAAWPYMERIVSKGFETALRECAPLRRGVVAWKGTPVGEALARAQGLSVIEPDELLVRLGA